MALLYVFSSACPFFFENYVSRRKVAERLLQGFAEWGEDRLVSGSGPPMLVAVLPGKAETKPSHFFHISIIMKLWKL